MNATYLFSVGPALRPGRVRHLVAAPRRWAPWTSGRPRLPAAAGPRWAGPGWARRRARRRTDPRAAGAAASRRWAAAPRRWVLLVFAPLTHRAAAGRPGSPSATAVDFYGRTRTSSS